MKTAHGLFTRGLVLHDDVRVCCLCDRVLREERCLGERNEESDEGNNAGTKCGTRTWNHREEGLQP